jgi:hypothetical protein
MDRRNFISQFVDRVFQRIDHVMDKMSFKSSKARNWLTAFRWSGFSGLLLTVISFVPSVGRPPAEIPPMKGQLSGVQKAAARPFTTVGEGFEGFVDSLPAISFGGGCLLLLFSGASLVTSGAYEWDKRSKRPAQADSCVSLYSSGGVQLPLARRDP